MSLIRQLQYYNVVSIESSQETKQVKFLVVAQATK